MYLRQQGVLLHFQLLRCTKHNDKDDDFRVNSGLPKKRNSNIYQLKTKYRYLLSPRNTTDLKKRGF